MGPGCLVVGGLPGGSLGWLMVVVPDFPVEEARVWFFSVLALSVSLSSSASFGLADFVFFWRISLPGVGFLWWRHQRRLISQ